MLSLIEWYFPWSRLDLVLRIELLIWLVVVGIACWISWRTLVGKKPWLRRRKHK
ncbi:hypothetical protein [Elongatibacter sediminis]|uniref:Uncharacterized protein n=1 Tax=Elongatibacter sediminis TaxID=3119006 RepID=A0AAW9R7G7_9GAMM